MTTEKIRGTILVAMILLVLLLVTLLPTTNTTDERLLLRDATLHPPPLLCITTTTTTTTATTDEQLCRTVASSGRLKAEASRTTGVVRTVATLVEPVLSMRIVKDRATKVAGTSQDAAGRVGQVFP